MWERAHLKEIAKQRLHNNYWSSVIVAWIFAIAMRILSFTLNFNFLGKTENHVINDPLGIYSLYNSFLGLKQLYSSPSELATFLLIFLLPALILIFLVAFTLITLLRLFVLNPLIVGCRHWFIQSRTTDDYPIKNILFAFKHGYKNVVKVMFLKYLFTFLWSLLFIIPGIVKSYEYRLIPYLLAENPNMNMNEAFTRSRNMMYGQKMNAFILDLSFIGWLILSSLTFGFLGIFYVNPYYAYTDMELYVTLCCNSSGRENSSYNQ